MYYRTNALATPSGQLLAGRPRGLTMACCLRGSSPISETRFYKRTLGEGSPSCRDQSDPRGAHISLAHSEFTLRSFRSYSANPCEMVAPCAARIVSREPYFWDHDMFWRLNSRQRTTKQ